MTPTINLINDIQKEVELERQGMLRIRRWIGGEIRVNDERWYQARAYRLPESKTNLDEASPMTEDQPRRKTFGSILTRFSNLLSSRRYPIGSKS